MGTTSAIEGKGKPTPSPTPTIAPPPKDCIQVMTPAVDPETGTCDEFSSMCEVPDGWQIVSSCSTT